MNRDELLANIKRDRARLDELIARVGKTRMIEPSLEGGWSVKDVLAHLSAWEKICMALVRNNEPVPGPPPAESGPSTDIINQKIYEGSRDLPLADVVAEAQASHAELLALVEGLSDEALATVLGASKEAARVMEAEGPEVGQLISANSDAHYREHVAQIGRWLGGA